MSWQLIVKLMVTNESKFYRTHVQCFVLSQKKLDDFYGKSVQPLYWNLYRCQDTPSGVLSFKYAEIRLEAYYSLFSFRKTATDSARFYRDAVEMEVSRFISRQIARIPLIFRRIVKNLDSWHLQDNSHEGSFVPEIVEIKYSYKIVISIVLFTTNEDDELVLQRGILYIHGVNKSTTNNGNYFHKPLTD